MRINASMNDIRQLVESLSPQDMAEAKSRFLASTQGPVAEFYRARLVRCEKLPTMFVLFAYDLIQSVRSHRAHASN